MDLSKIFDYFGIKYFEGDKLLTCPCPVHDGDNPVAFNITITGQYKGNWFCNTRNCHEEYYGIKGLLTGILENRGKEYYPEIFKDIFGDGAVFEEIREVLYCYQDEYIPVESNSLKFTTPVNIPSPYYLKRGFSESVLKDFMVGDYSGNDRQDEMYGRAVFPVFSQDMSYRGCVGRTLTNNKVKWRNSDGFLKSQTLYGLWKTQPSIMDSGIVVLVEGQGDVLKLYESGISNCAGMFSNFLCDDHIKLLLHMGVHTIILLKDNDEAGETGMKKIMENAGHLFHIVAPDYEANDIGDLTIEEIQETIVPKIKEHTYE